MDQNQKLGFLRDEYLKLQDQYEDFDRRSLTIKGWVAAGSVAALAIGFDPNKSNPMIWLVIGVVSACFWYLEAKWKLFQYAYRPRIKLLEAVFRSDPTISVEEISPFQIYTSWFIGHGDTASGLLSYRKKLLIAGRQQFVMLPYALFIVLSLVGLIWSFSH